MLRPTIPSYEEAVAASAATLAANVKPPAEDAPAAFKVNPIQERAGKRINTKFKPAAAAAAATGQPPTYYKVSAKSTSLFAQMVNTGGKPVISPAPVAASMMEAGDLDDIGRENQARLMEMTREEVLYEKDLLLKRFGKDMVKKIKAMKPSNSNRLEEPRAPTGGSFVQETFDKLPPSEQKKVQWMLEEEEVVPGTDVSQPRLDLLGEIVDAEKAEYQNELYHHAGPNLPGYTVEDLIHLSRSKMAPQRAIALQALALFLRNRVDHPARFAKVSLHQGQALMAIRMALDIEDKTCLPRAIEALYYFLIPRKGWGEDFHLRSLGLGYLDWGVIPRAQGSPLVNAPALEILENGPEFESESSELNDVQLAEFSPTLALIRSNTVIRLCYLLSPGSIGAEDEIARERLIAILLFLVRAQSVTERARDEDVLLKLVKRNHQAAAINLDLLLGLVNSSKTLCARIVAETDLAEQVLVPRLKLRDTVNSRDLAQVLFLLRACVLHGQLLQSVPFWVQALAEIVEDAVGDEREDGNVVHCASAALDIITYFCQQQALGGGGEEGGNAWFSRLETVAQLAQHFCIDASRLRISSSAVGLLESHARLASLTDNLDRSFNAVLIFLANVLARDGDEDDKGRENNVERWNALQSCALALKTFSQHGGNDFENCKYLAANPLFSEFWSAIFPSNMHQEKNPFPITLAQGLLFLSRNQTVCSLLELEREIRAHQFAEERIPGLDWRRAVAAHIAVRSGGRTVLTLNCINLLLAHEFGQDLFEELSPLFHDLLQVQSSEADSSSLVTCRDLEANFKLFARVNHAWPCLPLLLSRNLSTDVYLVCVQFAQDMQRCAKEEGSAEILGCLLSFAATTQVETFDDSSLLTPQLCSFFDSALVAANANLSMARILALLEGADKLLILAQDVARKLSQDLFENAFLERCVLLLLQTGMPLQVRVAVWNVLSSGRALPSKDWFLASHHRIDFGAEEEIYENMANVLVEGEALRASAWLQAHARQALHELFASKPEAWISKRLKPQVQAYMTRCDEKAQ